ncbi:hypothetical protein FGB62_42g23 [Gracilaria domingensis]|nr:hypothetical protein FGB62_42g23 [Gracilaria domingensis]
MSSLPKGPNCVWYGAACPNDEEAEHGQLPNDLVDETGAGSSKPGAGTWSRRPAAHPLHGRWSVGGEECHARAGCEPLEERADVSSAGGVSRSQP